MITVMPHNVAKKPIELVDAVSKEQLKRALAELAQRDNIPIEVVDETYGVNDGAWFSGILSKSTPCIAIYHTKHKKDYHSLVVELKDEYNRHYAYVHMGGKSRNAMDVNMGKTYYGVRNGEITEHRPGFLGKAFSTSAQGKLQDEELYYDVVYELIGSALARATTMPSSPAPQPVRTAAQPPRVQQAPARAAQPVQSEQGGSLFNNLKKQVKAPSATPDETVDKAAETIAAAKREAALVAYTNYKEGKGANRQIVAYLLSEFQQTEGIDVSDDVVAVSRLVEAAELASRELTEVGTATVNLPFFSADANGPKHLNVTLSQDMFSE